MTSRPLPRPTAAGGLDRAMAALAAVLLALLTLRAALTFDPYYDSVAYHLPFAARLAGLCPESCYLMSDYLEAVYDGFPKLFHRLQGLAWRLAGTPQAVDLLNVAALALFCLFLRRWFGVPAGWTLCALVAVPLVQIHATSTYVDLPVNLAAAAAILAFAAFLRDPGGFGRGRLAVLLGCLAFAANGKLQMLGLVAPLGLLFAAVALGMLAAGRPVGPFRPDRRGDGLRLAAVLVSAGALAAATSIANAIEHGNPLYPVRLSLFGTVLGGPIDGTSIGPDSLSDAWLAVPSPLRWLASVLEIDGYAYRPLPWTYDQGYCPDMLALHACGGPVGHSWWTVGSAFRMGGYFVAYVLALAAFLAWSLRRLDPATRRILGGTFAATTLLVAFLPRSHELRYYLFWMILLVSLCLASVFMPARGGETEAGAGGAGAAGAASGARPAAPLLAGIVLVALASVLLTTHGRYLTPAGLRTDEVVASLGIDVRVARLPDGGVICAGDSDWQPFTFLFARVFHPGRSHGLRDRPLEPACSATLPDRDR